jgi:hypothetical protein
MQGPFPEPPPSTHNRGTGRSARFPARSRIVIPPLYDAGHLALLAAPVFAAVAPAEPLAAVAVVDAADPLGQAGCRRRRRRYLRAGAAVEGAATVIGD